MSFLTAVYRKKKNQYPIGLALCYGSLSYHLLYWYPICVPA